MANYHPLFQRIALPFVAASFHFYFGYKVVGRENIPKGGCVVCPNHVQNSDPPLAAAAITSRHLIRVMAKKELFEGRGLAKSFFSRLITWLGAFPVDRNRADITAIKTALSAVREGKKLIIFPQGTRGAGEAEAKEGAAMLAVKTKAPVLPVYISEGKSWRCHATVVFGKPFYPENSKDYAKIAEDILRRIYALREEIK